MECNICGSDSKPFASARILTKYEISYFQCTSCKFLQTESPYWLEESYSEALATIDVGVMNRNLQNAIITSAVISLAFPRTSCYLDYGGGYGTLVRLMRDRGFNFFWIDRFAKNLHARGFEHAPNKKYDLLTAYEVMEHLPNPLADFAEMVKYSDRILATTNLLPSPTPTPQNWWYYALKSGQHVSFYSKESLQVLASHFGLHLISRGPYHLFTREKCDPMHKALFKGATIGRLTPVTTWIGHRPSLKPADLTQMSA
jgi:Methyltransferase domain